MTKKLHYQYVAIHVVYWATTVSSIGFVVPVLQKQNFNTIEIGLLLSVRALFSVIFQPIFSNLLDKYSHKVSLNALIQLMIVMSIGATFLQMSKPSFEITMLIFMIYGVFTFGISSFIDAMSTLYIHNGARISYPVARYMGSFSYAIFALLIGLLISPQAILSTQIIFFLILFYLVRSIDKVFSLANIEKSLTNKISLFKIMREYPLYSFFLIATALSFVGKEMSANFLINVYQKLGGNNSDYGFGLSIMAFAEVPIAFLFTWLSEKLGIIRLMIVSFLFASFRILMILIAPDVLVLNFAQVLQMLGTGLFWAGNVQFIRTILPANYAVKAQTTVGVCVLGIGSGVGSIASGFILEKTDLETLLFTSFLLSIMAAVVLLLGNRFQNKKQIS